MHHLQFAVFQSMAGIMANVGTYARTISYIPYLSCSLSDQVRLKSLTYYHNSPGRFEINCPINLFRNGNDVTSLPSKEYESMSLYCLIEGASSPTVEGLSHSVVSYASVAKQHDGIAGIMNTAAVTQSDL